MNELIERLAREAGFHVIELGGTAHNRIADSANNKRMRRFAKLIAEECAKIADASDEYIGDQIRERFKASKGIV